MDRVRQNWTFEEYRTFQRIDLVSDDKRKCTLTWTEPGNSRQLAFVITTINDAMTKMMIQRDLGNYQVA